MVSLNKLSFGIKIFIALFLDTVDFVLGVIIGWFPGLNAIVVIYQVIATVIMVQMIGQVGILTAWELIDLIPTVGVETALVPTYTIATIAVGGGYE